MSEYNIYIDESCHLLNDTFPVMCIGYIKIPSQNKEQHRSSLKKISENFRSFAEVKWTSVSTSRLSYYKTLIDYFFEHDMYFRCIINKNKQDLNHEKYNDGDHGKYYFKLVFLLIDTPINAAINDYNIFIDVKDTQGSKRIMGIESVLSNKYFNNSPFKRFQHLHSHDSIFMQLADLIIGAITFKLRGEHMKVNASKSKIELINHIESFIKRPIETGTRPFERKFNVFDHNPNKK